MCSFRVSAPGKVILFGEHSVVYGKTAVAASLNLRTKLRFREQPSNESNIRVSMPKLGIEKDVPVSLLQERFSSASFSELLVENHENLYAFVRSLVQEIGTDDSRQIFSLECFFYALAQIVKKEDLKLKPFLACVDTELSIGAGTGSSASFSVCLVAAFMHWSQLQKSPDLAVKIKTGASLPYDSAKLEKISKYALNCEKIMHGSPSGIDNSICTFGSIIEFRKGESPKFIPLSSRNVKILLVDTKVGRSTRSLVEGVALLRLKHPEIINKVLEAMDELSKRAIEIFEQMKAISNDDNDGLREAHDDLSDLILMNQGLLTTCQVSHFSLDLICATAKKYDFAAKLTGAGGGGYAYVLIPPFAPTSKVDDLTSELTANGFSVLKTDLGGSGVEVNQDC